MEPDKIELLFKRYLQNQSSPEEIKLLFQYFDIEKNEVVLKSLIIKELESEEDITDSTLSVESRMEEIFEKLKKTIRKKK